MLHSLQRIDTLKNMARFYGLDLVPTLFGDVAVERSWGRLGRMPRTRLDLYSSPLQAQVALSRLLDAKLRKGYTVVL